MKSYVGRYIRLSVIAAGSLGATSKPAISTSSASVAAGQSITVTSSVPVSWSLVGEGSLNSRTATSVVYTAPPSVIPQSAVLGCPVTANDSVFATRVDNLPRHPSGSTWLAHMSAVPLTVSPAWGITAADSTTPTTNWKPYYGNNNGDYHSVYSFPWPGRGPSLKRENGNYVGVTGYVSVNDHHAIVVRRSDCEYFESYNDRLNGETFPCRDGINQGCNISSLNVPYGFGSSPISNGAYAMPYASTDAAGLPLAPLSWHLDEIKAGVIKHAARFTASIGYINGAVWPATTANAYSPGAPPYGARFALKTKANGGPDLKTACLQSDGNVNADCVTMLTALQQYGMILADIGLNNEIQSFTDLTEDAVTRSAIGLIRSARIDISDFYAVDESSLRQTSENNFYTFANGSYSVNPDNGYVTPVSSAIVQAIAADGSSLKLPIPLQGTAVGLESNQLTIAPAMSGYKINSWVSPAMLSQSVTWSLVSGVGSITSGGVYTPPESVVNGASAVLKVIAAADAKAVNYVYVKVLNTNSSPVSGTIRIDSGSEVDTIDGYGNTWNSESGMEASVPTASAPDYPVWPGPEGTQYGTQLYTRGGDIAYRLVVPNGNYRIRVLYGQIFNGDATAGTFTKSFISSPTTIETQAQVVAHSYDWNVLAGFRYQTPADTVVPAKVVDNTLCIRTMVSTPDTAITALSGIAPLYPGLFPYLLSAANIKSSSINGIEIIPDTTAPHWSIDSQGVSSIIPGQNIQLYNIDWYTGQNDPVWTIVSGPSGVQISTSGLLIMPAGVITNSQPVVVMASDGRFSTTASFRTPGSAAAPAPIFPAPPAPSAPAPPPPSLPPASKFDYVRRLTVSHTQVIGIQTDFPVTVEITDPSMRRLSLGGHVQSNAGYDIVLASDVNGVKLLSWEVEQYDGIQGKWTGHVRVPFLSNAQDEVIYLLYGNPSISTSLSNKSAVWDHNYQCVYHFGSPTAIMNDSTKSALDGIASGWGYLMNGAIGGAANATNGSAILPTTSLLNSSGTIELWVNSSTVQDVLHNGGLVQQEWFDASPNGFYLGWSAYWNDFEVDWKANGQSTKMSATAAQVNLGVNKWNQIVYTWDRAVPAQTLFLNGKKIVASAQSFGNPSFKTPLSFSVPYNPSYYGISGLLDEIRISSLVRSPEWIATSFSNQKANSSFIVIGSEEQVGKISVLSGAKSRSLKSIAFGVVRRVAESAWHFVRELSRLA